MSARAGRKRKFDDFDKAQAPGHRAAALDRKRLAHPAPFARVTGVRFSMLTHEESTRSVVDMSKGSHKKNTPLHTSHFIMDARTGTPDPKLIPCATCGGALKCPGHDAHIMLPFPVYSQ